MLSGDGSSQPYAEPQDLTGEFLCPLKLAIDPAIIENQRVEVAVSGMEYVSYTKAVTRAKLFYFPQRLTKTTTGDHPILHQEVRAEPPGCGKGALPSLPDPGPFLLVLCLDNLAGSGGLDQLKQAKPLRLDLLGRPLELNDQDRGRALGISGIYSRLGRLDRQAVHDLHGSRQQPGSDHQGDRVTRTLKAVVGREDGVVTLRARQQPQGNLERYAEEPL